MYEHFVLMPSRTTPPETTSAAPRKGFWAHFKVALENLVAAQTPRRGEIPPTPARFPPL